MVLFSELIADGSTVAEVGGHIGYIAAYFAALAGKRGKLVVFEPGSNNLLYIRTNITSMGACDSLADVQLVEKAVGPKAGIAEFFEDDLTGQNNSIIKDFKGLEANSKSAVTETKVRTRKVELVSLDEHFGSASVDFIKIDVEGFEYGVLQGMTNILSNQMPIVMVEVQASEPEILALFTSLNYILFNEQRQVVSNVAIMSGNIFCLHKDKHKKQADSLKGK